MSKYGVFSGPNFPAFGLFLRFTKKISVFSPNTKKYGPEKTQYLDTFHVVVIYEKNDCLQIFMRNYPQTSEIGPLSSTKVNNKHLRKCVKYVQNYQ